MDDPLTAEEIIRLLGLEPLQGEGGYFRQTWVRPALPGARDDVPEATAILYLITADSHSALHRLQDDELFHFYLGDPCRMLMLDPQRSVREVILGPDLRAGMRVQHLVPGGTWQGTRLLPGGRFALLGTTMSPGFHPERFELAQRSLLDDLDATDRSRVEPFLAPA